ncbi:MAG: hypothetical protein LQ340_001358, partial [Diploschistes diacapsis]
YVEAPSVSALQEYLKSDLFLPYWEELKVAYIDKELENSAESLQKLGRANAWKTIHEAILSGEAQGPRKYTRNRPNKADWNRIDHYARYFAQVKRDARASTDSFTAKSLVRFPRPWISRSTTVSGRPTCLCGSTTGHRERNVLLRGSWASESRPSDENAEFRAHQLRVAAAEKRQQCRNETEQRTDFERRLADAAAAEIFGRHFQVAVKGLDFTVEIDTKFGKWVNWNGTIYASNYGDVRDLALLLTVVEFVTMLREAGTLKVEIAGK